jgi:hypothetical protein
MISKKATLKIYDEKKLLLPYQKTGFGYIGALDILTYSYAMCKEPHGATLVLWTYIWACGRGFSLSVSCISLEGRSTTAPFDCL